MRVDKDIRFSTVPEWIIFADVGAFAVRVWAVLDRHADVSRECYPSIARVCELARCSRNTAKAAIAELIRIGALEVEHRASSRGDADSNLYRLRVAPPGTGRSSGDPPLSSTDGGVGQNMTEGRSGDGRGMKALERKKEQQQRMSASDKTEPRRAIAGLLAVGMKQDQARDLVETYGEAAVGEQLLNLERHPGVTRKSGWIIAALRDGYELATSQTVERLPIPPTPEQAEAKARAMFPDKFAAES